MEHIDSQDQEARGRLGRAAEQAREVLGRTREGMAASASGLAEVAGRATEQLGRAAEIVREAEPDDALRERVSGVTERSVHRAGSSLNRAAPAIGRGAEKIADKAGAALHYAAGPLARILGTIAATIGGWWKTASNERHGMPATIEDEARAHFAAMTALPPDMTFERARTGYSLGYMAGRNPEYAGRSFEEVEADLRTGFGLETGDEYERLREFVRFGYERAAL